MSTELSSVERTPDGWIPLENRLYRREVVYDELAWDLRPQQLATAIVAIAPFGGPLALVPDAGWGLSYALATYSLSGQLIKSFDRLREKTVPPCRAVAVGWSNNDLLNIVYSDGAVARVPSGSELGKSRFINVTIGNNDERIFDAVVVSSGEIVMRGVRGSIYKLSPQDKVECENVTVLPPDGNGNDVPNSAIAAVKPELSPHGSLESLLVSDAGTIALVTPAGLYSMPGNHDVSHIAIAPNGQYIAAVDSNSGYLFVYTVDLRTEIARVNLVIELTALSVENVSSDFVFDAKRIDTVAWVGSDSIAVLYREHLALIGPHGGVAVLPLGENSVHGGVVLMSETDGLRLISSSSVQFVQMVPEPLSAVFYRKQSPGYKLLKSSGSRSVALDSTSTEALKRYRLLRELRESGSLLEAARSCTAAAYLESRPEEQKNLLQAAAYGQRYASVFAADAKVSAVVSNKPPQVIQMHKKRIDERSRRDVDMVPTAIAILRVLNTASAPNAGVPLTKPQLDSLGLPGLVARLSRYGKHTLAIRMASFGGISLHDVLSEWASTAVQANANESDETITSLISERFETVGRSYAATEFHGIRSSRALPYVNAAEAAFSLGRPKCAELLLRRETRPAPKVAMYLRMGREAPAIMASVASGDPELVLDALGTMLKTKSVRETARLLRSLPPALGTRATDLFASHLKQIGDLNSLRLVFHEVGRRREAALVDVHLAEQIEDSRQHMAALEKTAQAIGRGHSRRSCHFEVQALQHAAAVAASAIEVEKRGRLEPGTLRYSNDGDLLARAVLDIAEVGRRRDMLARLRRELRVPDRRFFWVCLDSMAEAGDFASIETLSQSAGNGRPPPIGLTAFVDTCIKYRRDEEAAKYAMRIADLRDRARALARCGHGREAADIASRLRNQQLLEEIQGLAARHVARITIPPEGTPISS